MNGQHGGHIKKSVKIKFQILDKRIHILVET